MKWTPFKRFRSIFGFREGHETSLFHSASKRIEDQKKRVNALTSRTFSGGVQKRISGLLAQAKLNPFWLKRLREEAFSSCVLVHGLLRNLGRHSEAEKYSSFAQAINERLGGKKPVTFLLEKSEKEFNGITDSPSLKPRLFFRIASLFDERVRQQIDRAIELKRRRTSISRKMRSLKRFIDEYQKIEDALKKNDPNE